jgi:hypothetical protein
MKKFVVVSALMASLFTPKQTHAWWGYEGHSIVVHLAMQFVTPEVQKNVLNVLNGMSLDSAGNWMDIMRSNRDYDFMKPWHYIDFAREKSYTPSTDENIVNRLIIVFNELRHKKVLCAEQVRMDLLILFHLMGDLHQPLHTGYDEDLGGNKVAVQYDTLKTNLHKFWDEDIIRFNKITTADCIELFKQYNKVDTIDGIHPLSWMKESRTLLASVYDYPNFTITDAYLQKNGEIVKRQLLLAGLRLAAILNKTFVGEAEEMNMATVTGEYKDGIDAKDAAKFIGKKVTACGKVYGVKTTDKVTFINVGAAFPNSPLTVVIFAKDRGNFKASPEELFTNKNICVKGEVVNYQGKAEIIVTKPEDIIIR